MRPVAVLFAILLIAACPPRRTRVVYAPRCPQPAPVVVSNDANPPTKAEDAAKLEKPVDPLVAEHLKRWEEKTAALTNVRAEVALKRVDSVTGKESQFSGQALLLKPNYAVLRLNNTADKTGTDYEAYICNGKTLYAYNGIAKTVTEFELPEGGIAGDNLMFDLFTRVKANDLSERFDITVFKTDEIYTYLDIKPRLAKDRREFQHLRLALYGSGPSTAKVSHLPAQVYMLKPNGDTELWKLTNLVVDVPGVEPKHFQYVEVKEKGWSLQKFNKPLKELLTPKP